MSTSTAKVVPSGVAGDLAALATLLDAETDITSALQVPSATKVGVLRNHIEIVATAGSGPLAETALDNAIAAVAVELLPGDEAYVTVA